MTRQQVIRKPDLAAIDAADAKVRAEQLAALVEAADVGDQAVAHLDRDRSSGTVRRPATRTTGRPATYRRLTPVEVAAIVAGAAAGARQVDLAAAHGVTRSAVCNLLRRARGRGAGERAPP
jgi:hypothetical protein